MKKFLTIMLISTLSAISLTACGTENDKEVIQSESTINTESDIINVGTLFEPLTITTNYGFNLKLPADWNEKCTIETSESADTIALFTKSIKDSEDNGGYQGWLGTFEKISDESLTYDEFIERSEELTGGLGFRYMYSDENGTYGIQYPSELQWNPDNESQINDWTDMFALMNDITIVDNFNEVLSVDPSADDIEFINKSISDIRNTNIDVSESDE